MFKLANRFRWAFCQLEVLRNCLPSSIRYILNELPESLDETYERVLREIMKPNRDHARRLLQCLVVALRPLRVEELAEVLAVDFDDASGIPKLKPSWRWEDQEQALLTSCSSLIVIVGTGPSRVVQFSHFSVKEFLTSARLTTSSQDVSRYHIDFGPSHAVLAQACLSILLQLGHLNKDSIEERSPLAAYAARCWVRHAQFEDVASRIKGMEDLFDPDKPYFAAWRKFHDMDTIPSPFSAFYLSTGLFLNSKSDTSTLYYAALCGFTNLVEHLIVKHPEDVNATGGYYMTPAVAALAGRHFQSAQVLHRAGSSVDPRGSNMISPLHSAAYFGNTEMVRVLLDYGIDVNTRDDKSWTPLFYALDGYSNDRAIVVRLLLDRGADPNMWTATGTNPLFDASRYGRVEMARLLIEHGASVETRDSDGETALEIATKMRHDEIVKLLIEHGAS